ncbi:LA_0364 family Cys-rich lipoprotein [Leptospira weilii]|nr:hypothetical protein BUQ74_16765 [Leptospira weilii serovar Heyan]
MKRILILSLLFGISCSEYISPRHKCYLDNSCNTAVMDCLMGAELLKTLLDSNPQTSTSQNPILSIFYNPLFCVDAKQTCVNDCDTSHPF